MDLDQLALMIPGNDTAVRCLFYVCLFTTCARRAGTQATTWDVELSSTCDRSTTVECFLVFCTLSCPPFEADSKRSVADSVLKVYGDCACRAVGASRAVVAPARGLAAILLSSPQIGGFQPRQCGMIGRRPHLIRLGQFVGRRQLVNYLFVVV